jgi:hypothetical protein
MQVGVTSRLSTQHILSLIIFLFYTMTKKMHNYLTKYHNPTYFVKQNGCITFLGTLAWCFCSCCLHILLIQMAALRF